MKRRERGGIPFGGKRVVTINYCAHLTGSAVSEKKPVVFKIPEVWKMEAWVQTEGDKAKGAAR